MSSINKKRDRKEEIELDETAKKYARDAITESISRKKPKAVRKTLENLNSSIKKSAIETANTEILLSQEAGYIEPDEGEKVYKLSQKVIKKYIDSNASTNIYDFQLTKFGPYTVNYSRNGRHLLFGGRRGHIASLDSLRTNVNMELQLQEEVYDVCYLHNETMFAVAQKKYAYIYDQNGVEIHSLRKHERPYKLDYLPYHYLLTSIGQSGFIRWQDISTGTLIHAYQTGHGPCRVLRHNPQNAVSFCGHSNGVVSLWCPTQKTSLVSMFCHKSPITDVAIDRDGQYMVTAGLDTYLKIWDLRTYRIVHCYKPPKPVVSIDISDKKLIAIGYGREVQILKNAFKQPLDVTYLQHEIRPPDRSLCAGTGSIASTKALLSSVSIHNVKFRPYEDSLCIGHSHGITSIVVPGAGEPNYDSYEANPFSTSEQRKEQEVQSLLNKLSADMIGLDSAFVGTVDQNEEELEKELNETFYHANKEVIKKKDKNKMRGRNKISAKLKLKQKNVIEKQHEKHTQSEQQKEKELTKEEKKKNGKNKQNVQNDDNEERNEERPYNPLHRFMK